MERAIIDGCRRKVSCKVRKALRWRKMNSCNTDLQDALRVVLERFSNVGMYFLVSVDRHGGTRSDPCPSVGRKAV